MPSAAVNERDDQGAVSLRHAEQRRINAHPADVFDSHRLRRPQRGTRRGGFEWNRGIVRHVRVAGHRRDPQKIALPQPDQQGVGVNEGSPPLDD